MAFLIDQLNNSGLFAQSAYSAGIATCDSDGNVITATYLSSVDLTPYQTTADMINYQTVSGMSAYATTGAVDNKLDTTAFSDVSGTFLTSHQSLDGYATTAWVDSQGYLTAHQPISADEWNNVYDTVNVYSGAWTGSESSPTASVDSNGSIDIVSSNNTVYFDVNGAWFNNAVNSALPTSAAQWNSNYDTVNTNSGVWGGSALNISAGEGVKVTLVNNNNLVFSTDETVLWSGSSALTAINGSANGINLSESPFNFERVAVYGRPLSTHNVLKIVEFEPDSNKEGFDWLTWFKGGGTGGAGAIRFGGAFMQYNENKLWAKSDEFFQLSVASGGISMQSNQNIITEIIGINRINNA